MLQDLRSDLVGASPTFRGSRRTESLFQAGIFDGDQLGPKSCKKRAGGRLRNQVEQCPNTFENAPRLACHDKTAEGFLCVIDIILMRLWIHHLSTWPLRCATKRAGCRRRPASAEVTVDCLYLSRAIRAGVKHSTKIKTGRGAASA